MLLIVAMALTRVLMGASKAPVTKVTSIALQGRAEAILEDVCTNGLVVLNEIGYGTGTPPSVLEWDLESNKSVFQIPMDAWVKEQSALREAGHPSFEASFRCVDAGKRLLALEGMYLVLIDVEKRQDIVRVLPSKDLNDMTSPLLQVMWHVTDRTVDVNAQTGSVAAAYNWGTKPRVFVYGADLRRLVSSWDLPRYIEDIHWSPDGQKLAVLYSGGFDAQGKFVGADPEFKLAKIPDVEIFDASSGKSQLRFFSGDMEAKIAFSPDGTRLYTVSLSKYNIATGNEAAVRVFSSSDGSLLQTMVAHPWRVRDNFALSPDGKLIVADATTPAPAFFLREIFAEEQNYRKMARFVILDAQTGRLPFEHHQNTPGASGGVNPMRFGFSPDSRKLLVDPNFEGWGHNERVDVYSLDRLRSK